MAVGRWMRGVAAAVAIGAAMAATGQTQERPASGGGPSDHAGHAGHGGHAGHSGAPAAHAGHARAGGAAAPADTRQPVVFPEPLRTHTLANMRDHLLAIAEIQEHLAAGAWDRAAATAEARLGMASLQSHGAHDVARHMPPGMQQAGSAMHQAASRFARAATDASVTGDTRAALKALAEVSRTCVACHAGYRLQ